jgi:hypothetical protein
MGLRVAVISNSEALPSEVVEAMIVKALTSQEPLAPPRTTPQPGGEVALRGQIAGIASGSPDYAALTAQMADLTRAQLPALQAMLQRLGALRSLEFKAVSLNGVDQYLAQFDNGALLYAIALDAEGKLGFVSLRPVGQPPS